ncbi:degenerin-like protein asic-1 [Battus philenor]|uniref:degenerin-like protein asic-1 n=1 Tax=Battus philenor TaxID=42288 RepID=UPI0035D06815
MNFLIDEEAEKELVTIKEKCVRCLKGPNLLKTLVVAGCLLVVVQQIGVCVNKLINSPITTYTHFDFNKTITYPSITLCREPAYKYDKLLDYGLYSHPRYTSTWINYNFSAVSLDRLWKEITYGKEDFFVQYGLDGYAKNVKVTSTLGFVTGRCFTLRPLVLSRHASRSSGYSITLRHRAVDVTTSASLHPPGYHVFVHYHREPFTEVEVYNGGLVDYFYMNTGETIDAKLSVDEYVKLPKDHDPCSYQKNYSANECTTKYVWRYVEKQAGCSGPWMRSSLPRCANYTAMRNLITTYMRIHEDHGCKNCPRFCHSYLYKAFVTDRQSFYTWDAVRKIWHIKTGDAALQSQLYIYFNSMMVSVYEERYNYDWNLFMSDLGGNIGFLLGLSVISLISIIGSVWFDFIKPLITKKKIRKDIMSVTSSTLTADNRQTHARERKKPKKKKTSEPKAIEEAKCYELLRSEDYSPQQHQTRLNDNIQESQTHHLTFK